MAKLLTLLVLWKTSVRSSNDKCFPLSSAYLQFEKGRQCDCSAEEFSETLGVFGILVYPGLT